MVWERNVLLEAGSHYTPLDAPDKTGAHSANPAPRRQQRCGAPTLPAGDQ